MLCVCVCKSPTYSSLWTTDILSPHFAFLQLLLSGFSTSDLAGPILPLTPGPPPPFYPCCNLSHSTSPSPVRILPI
uniref:Uncharacterized protein n=1 Tax=Octopus bimaculoides TaxID=37653 RepID=A0A0L8H5L8_OCTBM